MKRFHVHVNVERLDESIRFYTTLIGAEPSVTKPDYAKWMLDDPRVTHGEATISTSAPNETAATGCGPATSGAAAVAACGPNAGGSRC